MENKIRHCEFEKECPEYKDIQQRKVSDECPCGVLSQVCHNGEII